MRAGEAGRRGASVIEPQRNVGFGAAINLGFRQSRSPYLAALNDDAAPRAEWIEALVAAAEAHPDAGMFASQVRFYGEEHLDSAGMVIARDGSSKQRGHLFPAGEFEREEEVLLPSGVGGAVSTGDAGADRAVRRGFFSLLRGHGSRPAGAMGGLEMHLRAWGGGGASLLALGGTRLAAQGILRGTEPAVRGGEEFSAR